MLAIVSLERKDQTSANPTMEKVVLGTHNKFSIHNLVDVAVLRKRLKLGLSPDLLYNLR
jgi:hypothetical protein